MNANIFKSTQIFLQWTNKIFITFKSGCLKVLFCSPSRFKIFLVLLHSIKKLIFSMKRYYLENSGFKFHLWWGHCMLCVFWDEWGWGTLHHESPIWWALLFIISWLNSMFQCRHTCLTWGSWFFSKDAYNLFWKGSWSTCSWQVHVHGNKQQSSLQYSR